MNHSGDKHYNSYCKSDHVIQICITCVSNELLFQLACSFCRIWFWLYYTDPEPRIGFSKCLRRSNWFQDHQNRYIAYPEKLIFLRALILNKKMVRLNILLKKKENPQNRNV